MSPESAGGDANAEAWVILNLNCRRCRKLRARLLMGRPGSTERWWSSRGRRCWCHPSSLPDPAEYDGRISREWRRGVYPTLFDYSPSARAPFTVWI